MTNQIKIKELEKCVGLIMQENLGLNARIEQLENVMTKQNISLWEKIKWIFRRK